MHSEPPPETSEHEGFAPYDTTDRRKPGDWKSRYQDPIARKGIRTEAVYIAVILATVPTLMFIMWVGWPKEWLHLSETKYRTLLHYSFAWLAGTLGGTLFDLKWLYHAIAKNEWHLDRRHWRLFTPHISGGLSFALVALFSSGLVHLFDRRAIDSTEAVVGMAFLVGYFSDSAIAKLSQLAETLFGENRQKDEKRNRPECPQAATKATVQPNEIASASAENSTSKES